MKLPAILDLVKGGNRTRFTHFAEYQLWYTVTYDVVPEYESGTFNYPVPVGDASGGVFLAEDKAILHMRWIRKHIDLLTGCQQSET